MKLDVSQLAVVNYLPLGASCFIEASPQALIQAPKSNIFIAALRATFRILPLPIVEREQFVDVSADMASFAGWEEPVCFNDTTPVPLFVFQHIYEGAPPAVDDILCAIQICEFEKHPHPDLPPSRGKRKRASNSQNPIASCIDLARE